MTDNPPNGAKAVRYHSPAVFGCMKSAPDGLWVPWADYEKLAKERDEAVALGLAVGMEERRKEVERLVGLLRECLDEPVFHEFRPALMERIAGVING